MKRQIVMLGVVGGLLVALLQWTEYRFLVVEHSVEIYSGIVAAVFAALGIWLGLRLTARKQGAALEPELLPQPVTAMPSPFVSSAFVRNEAKRDELGLTRREMEILSLVAEGLTNREIGERLFVSENTVKTHCSRAFDKLGAKRRTQAVQMGKAHGLLP